MKKNSGFSLIEILIASGLMFLVLGGITGIMALITKTNQKTESVLSVRREGEEAVQLVNKYLTGGFIVLSEDEEDGCLCGSNMTSICLKQREGGPEIKLICDENNNIIKIGDLDVISNTNLRVSDCNFSCSKLATTNKYKIDFSFKLTTVNDGTNETFKTRAITRNVQN